MPLSPSSLLVRPIIRKLDAYTPGEQPKIPGLIKLNTNENPYPPSAKVLTAAKAAVDGRLRLYPSPTAEPLREKLATLHRCTPEHIIVGNGSDELLAMAVRAFVEPALQQGNRPARRGKLEPAVSRSNVQFFTPSYSLYPVLAKIHGANIRACPLHPDFSLPVLRELELGQNWDFRAALTLVTTPNAPSGRAYATADLARLCRSTKGVVILDEAYVDFSQENAMELALKMPNVLVARTFSKAYSLCFQRVGYFVGDRGLIAGLQKIRDSYNVNGLGQVAALATLDSLPYYQANFKKIIASRENLSRALRELDFEVFPSQTNFILVRPPIASAEQWMIRLRAKKILVRWFSAPDMKNYLRITVGTAEQVDTLVRIARQILKGLGSK